MNATLDAATSVPNWAQDRLGMGCWAIGGHGWGQVDQDESVAAIDAAAGEGVQFFDTADVYGLGKSESLLAEVLGQQRHNVHIASKGGVRWDQGGKVWNDVSPNYLRTALEASLRRLRLERISLYYVHKPDGVTPIAASIEALARFRDEGKIGAIGVSNFSAEQLREALSVAPIAAVQIRLNLIERKAYDALRSVCAEHGVRVVAWGALADGLLTGKFNALTRFAQDDHRSRMPSLQGLQFERNVHCVEELKALAELIGQPLSQVALRWVLDLDQRNYALFGAKNPQQVRQNLASRQWRLTVEQCASLEALVAPHVLPLSVS